jgi:hypothetical protein
MQQQSMGPGCGLVGPGMYPASSGDPGECGDEEAIDETQTTESRVRLYLFQLEKTEFGLNISLKVKDLCQQTERANQLMMVCLQLDASKSVMNAYP